MGESRSRDARRPRESGSQRDEPAAHPLTVTVEQAAMMLGISRTSAYACVARNEIPTVRLGRRVLVPTSRLMAMLNVGEYNATVRPPVAAAEQLTLHPN
jgi:excisionase family DNA binding protein